jgi:RNA polymerase sigma-70 factor (ECF subfamily)
MTDQELLLAYDQSRDVESLGTFVERYQNPLLRFASRMLSDETAAQDVVQEAFLRVARDPRRLLKVENCHNWLMRIVRNICIDHIRKAVRQRKAMKEMAARAEDVTVTSSETSPEAALEREETHALVHQAIASLKPRYRELVILKVQEGKSYREIAEITGLSATNVGYLLHHAMKALSHRLRGQEALS